MLLVSYKFHNGSGVLSFHYVKFTFLNCCQYFCAGSISEDIIERDPLSLTIWNDANKRKLNSVQQKALKLSVSRKFQLIQGPPGKPLMIHHFHLHYYLRLHHFE